MLIFEHSRTGRRPAVAATRSTTATQIPSALLRTESAGLPEVSELQVVRHYTRLSQKNMSVDTHLYPLGSCTMKYNPTICHELASQGGFLNRHPCDDEKETQGLLASLYDFQELLSEATGMSAFSLTAAAGAQGEWAGMAMIRAYHESRADHERTEVLIPAAAHGTNPATAAMCGYKIIEVPLKADGDLNLDALSEKLSPRTAAIMLTNPSTLGIFERQIGEIAKRVHDAGGLLYYDGANLNAILGEVKPGDMGFDAMHINLHKTFAAPHGGGGPGAGAVGVGPRLVPFLPIPHVGRDDNGYRWLDRTDIPLSIGRLSAFAGNIGVLLRAYVYALRLGDEGMRRVARYATLNSNYLLHQLQAAGFNLPYGQRRACHEFVVSLAKEAQSCGLTALVFAKNLLDRDIHAPTVYFPQLVAECLLIEPTETESKEDLDRLLEAMRDIRSLAKEDPDYVQGAPHWLPIGRLDELRAARQLDLNWKQEKI